MLTNWRVEVGYLGQVIVFWILSVDDLFTAAFQAGMYFREHYGYYQHARIIKIEVEK